MWVCPDTLTVDVTKLGRVINLTSTIDEVIDCQHTGGMALFCAVENKLQNPW
jgi:hypothetical protein